MARADLKIQLVAVDKCPVTTERLLPVVGLHHVVEANQS